MKVQKNIQELREEFWMEIQSLQNTVLEMKHTMEGFKNRLDIVEEMVNIIEIREQECKEAEVQREKRINRNERILREMYNQSKWKNILIMSTRRKRERKRDRKHI